VANYGVYASATLDAVPSVILVNDTTAAGYGPALCMSCHDGTVSVFSVQNAPNDNDPVTNGGAAGNVLGTGLLDPVWDGMLGATLTALSNEHPIGFVYDAALVTLDGDQLEDPTGAVIAGWLGTGGVMECDTCHDPHAVDNGGTPFPSFLREDTDGSALCITCHIK